MTPWLVVGGLLLFGLRDLLLADLERGLGKGLLGYPLASGVGHFLLALSLTLWTVAL